MKRKHSPISRGSRITSKAGWRVVGGKRTYFRSQMEANYARYLEWLRKQKQIAAFSHEHETFWFPGIKRGCVSYLPDFRIVNNDGTVEYHETKGYMDNRSKTKIKRMAKYYPEVVLKVIDYVTYSSIARTAKALIPDWE